MIYLLPKLMVFCLTMTILLEGFFAILLGVRKKKDIINIVLVNIMTNPLLVSVSLTINALYGLNARHISMIVLELMAFLVESIIYKNVLSFKKINPFLLSLILNLFSFLIGVFINNI